MLTPETRQEIEKEHHRLSAALVQSDETVATIAG